MFFIYRPVNHKTNVKNERTGENPSGGKILSNE